LLAVAERDSEFAARAKIELIVKKRNFQDGGVTTKSTAVFVLEEN
jgi:hypothetical protein